MGKSLVDLAFVMLGVFNSWFWSNVQFLDELGSQIANAFDANSRLTIIVAWGRLPQLIASAVLGFAVGMIARSPTSKIILFGFGQAISYHVIFLLTYFFDVDQFYVYSAFGIEAGLGLLLWDLATIPAALFGLSLVGYVEHASRLRFSIFNLLVVTSLGGVAFCVIHRSVVVGVPILISFVIGGLTLCIIHIKAVRNAQPTPLKNDLTIKK